MRAVVVTSYVRGLTSLSAAQLADMLQAVGCRTTMHSLVKPERFVDRHWDSRVVTGSMLFDRRDFLKPTAGFYFPAVGFSSYTDSPYLSLNKLYPSVKSWYLVATPCTVPRIKEACGQGLEFFRGILVDPGMVLPMTSGLLAKGVLPRECNISVHSFDLTGVGYEYGARVTRRHDSKTTLLLIADNKLLRNYQAWVSYEYLINQLVEQLPSICITLLLESSVSRGVRVKIRNLVRKLSQSFKVERLEYLSDLSRICGDYDIVVDLNRLNVTGARISAAQASSAAVLAFQSGSCVSRIRPGRTGQVFSNPGLSTVRGFLVSPALNLKQLSFEVVSFCALPPKRLAKMRAAVSQDVSARRAQSLNLLSGLLV